VKSGAKAADVGCSVLFGQGRNLRRDVEIAGRFDLIAFPHFEIEIE